METPGTTYIDEEHPHAVFVKFKEYGVWSSKGYAYKTRRKYEKGEGIVVPVGGWYAVGRVYEFIENHPFKEHIKYKIPLGSLRDLG